MLIIINNNNNNDYDSNNDNNNNILAKEQRRSRSVPRGSQDKNSLTRTHKKHDHKDKGQILHNICQYLQLLANIHNCANLTQK